MNNFVIKFSHLLLVTPTYGLHSIFMKWQIYSHHAFLKLLINLLVPLKTIRRVERRSDSWFDRECRLAKRTARKSERRYLTSLSHHSSLTSACLLQWKTNLRRYRTLAFKTIGLLVRQSSRVAQPSSKVVAFIQRSSGQGVRQ